MHEHDIKYRGTHSLCPVCSFDNAEVYADGKAETVMGQAIKVSSQNPQQVRTVAKLETGVGMLSVSATAHLAAVRYTANLGQRVH